MRAVAGDAEIAACAEHLAADHVGRSVDHHTGPVTAGRARPHRLRHAAECGRDIAAVDACRVNLHQHLACCTRRRIAGLQLQVEFVDRGGLSATRSRRMEPPGLPYPSSDGFGGAGMNTPLAGITVIDFGQIFQGPYATLLMAKAGANVIKIEPPHGEPGDAARRPASTRRCRWRC